MDATPDSASASHDAPPAGARARRGTLALLFVAVALLAASSPVVRWLQENQPLMVEGQAISFCNVLFVGNFMAGLVALVFFRPSRIRADLRATSSSTRWLLLASAILAVFIPALLFSALQYTSVTTLVLLGRFESVAFAVLAAIVLGQTFSRFQWAGYTTIALGILGLVLFQTDWMLMRGEVYILLAALLQAFAALLSRRVLAGCELGSFVFVRNLASALVFFVVAIVLYGPEHFMDAFGPRLWAVMVFYAVVIVVIGQSAWYRSLASLTPRTVADMSMLGPLLGISFAWLLLDEVPAAAQWAGAAIILVGMFLTRIGTGAQPVQEAGEAYAEKSLSGA